MNYAPVHEPKPWEESNYKNINSDDDSDIDVEDEEDQSVIDDSEIETSSVDDSEISEQETVTTIFKNRMKKSHPQTFKNILQEEEFFPE